MLLRAGWAEEAIQMLQNIESKSNKIKKKKGNKWINKSSQSDCYT